VGVLVRVLVGGLARVLVGVLVRVLVGVVVRVFMGGCVGAGAMGGVQGAAGSTPSWCQTHVMPE